MPIASSLAIVLVASAQLAQDPPSHAYYPVNIGDRWEYESNVRGRFVNEVVSVDGPVSRIKSTDASGRASYLHVVVRGDSILVGPDGQEPRLLIDFGAPLGASFVGSAGSASAVVTFATEHEVFEVSGVEFHNVREYQHQSEAGAAYRTYYARNVGLVGMQWESGMSVWLVAADVGGTRAARE